MVPEQIIAMGGGGFSMEPENLALDRYVLSQARSGDPIVCFVPTASGDSDNYVRKFYASFSRFACRPRHLSLFEIPTRDLRSYLSSHPSTESRIQTLQQALQPADSALAPLLPSVRWDRVRALCRPTPTPPPPTDAGRVNHHNRSVAPPLSSSPRAIAHPPR